MTKTNALKALLLVLLFSVMWFGYNYVYDKGYEQGLTDMHTLCHDIGGLMLNKENNKLIICENAGIAPKVH